MYMPLLPVAKVSAPLYICIQQEAGGSLYVQCKHLAVSAGSTPFDACLTGWDMENDRN
jgi:hypothetical protein